MTQHTYFKCYLCRKGFYGKTALSTWNGHLTCYDCVTREAALTPVFKFDTITFYTITYRTARKSNCEVVLRAAAFPGGVEEAKAWVIKRKRAKEILVCLES